MKHTARAVLTNEEGLCFLALHNHYLPENIGKWGTIGGIMDSTDPDILFCLRRELSEEFAGVAAKDFEVGAKLAEIEKNGALHHFFHVKTTLRILEPSQPEEVLQVGFFSLSEVAHFKKLGKLYFDVEDALFAQALGEST